MAKEYFVGKQSIRASPVFLRENLIESFSLQILQVFLQSNFANGISLEKKNRRHFLCEIILEFALSQKFRNISMRVDQLK